MSGYLDRINEANDIKKIEPEAYDALASEIRSFIIESVSEHGGHLASNLGVVELTMALHLCMDFPNDKLIWDVGHQAYTHKLLTGRKEDFSGLRTFGGMKRALATLLIQDTVPHLSQQHWVMQEPGI